MAQPAAPGANPAESSFPPFLQQSFCPENVGHNAKQLYYIRSVSLSLAGSTCGLLGLTNLSGFLFYIAVLVLINQAIYLFSARGAPSSYDIGAASVRQGKQARWWNKRVELEKSKGGRTKGQEAIKVQTPGLGLVDYGTLLLNGGQENAFSYILWWTFWYGIVHVYD